MEEAVFLMDENSKNERTFLTQILKAERKLMSAPLNSEGKLLLCSQNLSKIVRDKFAILSEQNLALSDAIKLLTDLQCDVDKFVGEDTGVSDLKQIKANLEEIQQSMRAGKEFEEAFTVVSPLSEKGNICNCYKQSSKLTIRMIFSKIF